MWDNYCWQPLFFIKTHIYLVVTFGYCFYILQVMRIWYIISLLCTYFFQYQFLIDLFCQTPFCLHMSIYIFQMFSGSLAIISHNACTIWILSYINSSSSFFMNLQYCQLLCSEAFTLHRITILAFNSNSFSLFIIIIYLRPLHLFFFSLLPFFLATNVESPIFLGSQAL